MAQVAAGLKRSGREITGSDQGVYPPMSDYLRSQGIEVLSPYHEHHVTSADVVIIGNALSRGNPEVEATLEKRIPYLSLPELIHAEILRDKLPAVVAGTHGKTTTTAALAHILQYAGLSPGYMVGGLPVGWQHGFDIGSGRWFVIEGDEYDCAFFDKRPKFLHYQPQLVILNNLEFDHADIYASVAEIRTQFRRLIKLIPRNGGLVVNADWSVLMELASEAHCPVVPYGRGTNAAVRSELIGVTPSGMEFILHFASGHKEVCSTILWGDHQLANLTAASAAAEQIGVDPGAISEAVKSFRGVQRRLQLKYSDGQRWLYDDFAHHPTAVKETLTSLKKRHPHLPVFAAFEPRSNTMVRKFFQKEITQALSLADGIALCDIHRSEKIAEEDRLNIPQIIGQLQHMGKKAFYHKESTEIALWIGENLPESGVIVTMSSGFFSGLINKLLAYFQKDTQAIVGNYQL